MLTATYLATRVTPDNSLNSRGFFRLSQDKKQRATRIAARLSV
jgi:hypothetical protein